MREELARIVSSKRTRGIALLIGLWACIALALFLVREILLPFLLAVFLAYLLAPLVRRMEHLRIRGRSLSPIAATLVVYVVLCTLLALLGRAVVPQIVREVGKLGRMSSQAVARISDEAPSWPDRVARVLERYEIPVRFVWGEKDLNQSHPALPAPELPGVDVVTGAPDQELRSIAFEVDLKKELSGYVAEFTDLLGSGVRLAVVQLQSLVRNMIGFVFKTFLVLMMTAFLLGDPERVKRFIFSLIPINDRAIFDGLLARIDTGLSGVVRGQIMICLINGLLTLLGLLLLGVPLPFVLAGVATVLSLIPIFGSIISTIPIVAVALTVSLPRALLALLWIIAIHLLESNFLNPKVMGDSARIHPVIVILALLVGEHFYGLVGALFAVPITSILLTLFRFLLQRADALQNEASAASLPSTPTGQPPAPDAPPAPGG
ncbi:MAG: AI-2E family transporter [Deltaproteobacteria bacterium]|nr:AI-2E family transporter [Deltaproteobacteria bacterium]